MLTWLGGPFTFASLYEERLVQQVVPVPGQEDAQTSEGSDALLQWHVEDAFTAERWDFFVEDAAESVTSSDAEVFEGVQVGDGFGLRALWCCGVKCAVVVVEVFVFTAAVQ